VSQSPDNSLNTIIFTCTTAILCAVGLAIAATALKPRQQENVRVDKMKNILKAFDVLDAAEESGSVSDYFEANVEGVVVNKAGEVVEDAPSASEIDYEAEFKDKTKEPRLPLFVLKQEGEVVAYTMPVMGKGLWSTLLGYMSFDKDLNNVRGITFYDHGETPGLGAEIDAPWFQQNFKGKKVLDESGKTVGITVVKGKAADVAKSDAELSHMVDGISGATITANGVTDMITKDLGNYAAYFASLREGK
jgi:Na+-transporting NADH:ubiquinone oxidoreductase subunit C